MLKLRNLLICSTALCAFAAPALAEKLGLGRQALPEEVAAWDKTVLPDGTGLPEGSGDVMTGDEVFGEKCASCHGEFAEGLDSWPVLAGGANTLKDVRPVKTVGSYWPHLSTVWDYVHRTMPFGAAQTITPDEAYAITAFLMYSNGLVEDDFVLSKANFTEVKLPNEGGFYPDDRPVAEYPLFSTAACETACSAPVKITKRAIDLKVTPMGEDGLPAGTLPNIELAVAGDAAPPAAAPVQQADAGADQALIDAGAKVFRKCTACHKVGDSAKNGVGPVLNGVVGRAVGTFDGFKYSAGMADMGAGGQVWDQAALHSFLENPKGFVKGTKMSFAGLKAAEDRDAVIAYLQSLGG